MYECGSKEWEDLAVRKFRWQDWSPEELEGVPNSANSDGEGNPSGDETDVSGQNSGVDDDGKPPHVKNADNEKYIKSGNIGKVKNDFEDSKENADTKKCEDPEIKDSNKRTDNSDQPEEEQDIDTKNPMNVEKSGNFGDTPPKVKKRKASEPNTRAPENRNLSKRVCIKVECDGSRTKPTLQSDDRDSSHLTQPLTKRQKVSTKSRNERDKKANESDKHTDISGDENRDDANVIKNEAYNGVRQRDQKKGAKQTVTPSKKGGNKSAINRKKASSAASRTKPPKKKRWTIKAVKAAHAKQETSKEDALLSAMIVHHMMGTKTLPFEKLISDLGYKPKNKNLEQAWKNLRTQKLVEEGTGCNQKKRVFTLTQKGIDKIAPQDYKDELANPPKTTAELHERIKNNAVNNYGVKIFDLLLEARKKKESMRSQELASECGCNPNSHGFFYALKQLKGGGYVVPDPKEKRKLVLSDTCFLDG